MRWPEQRDSESTPTEKRVVPARAPALPARPPALPARLDAPAPNRAWARAALQSALDTRPSAQVSLARSSAGRAPLQPYTRFGDYELLERLGHGATATVYRARQLSLNRVVALKVMHEADLASAADLSRFSFGAQAAAELDHPNIAPIYQVGVHEGVPFYAMRLFEGGTLGHARARLRNSHVSIATLMAKIAGAVHYAHERGVLHRDLKPANVVLDEHDEPFVVDFGFAKHLDERAVTSKPSILVGTMGYMAPEQAAGASRSLTFASDIYGLGAILYELLTGEVPFQGLGLAELVERLTSAEPVRSPRTLDASIDRELEYVCLKCLEKDPLRRYRTAAELARDLTRWLHFEPISIRTDNGAARLWRWCRLHPALTTLLAGAVGVLAATAKVSVSVAHEQEQALLSEVLHANSYAAQAKAGQVLFQLRELSSPVARCASDPRIADILVHAGEPAPSGQADRLLVECGARSLFDSVTVLDREGSEHARLPHHEVRSSDEVRRSDYFVGAQRLGESGYRSVHVGRVVRAGDGGERHVSLSAPVFGSESQWLGVVSVTIDMRAFLESLHLSDSGRQMAVLAGVREREPSDPSAAEAQGVIVLLHGGLGDTQALSTANAWMKELTQLKGQGAGRDPFRFSDEPNHSLEDNPQVYPMSAFGNRWLAGFAPVGHTGYAVVVQTKYDAALEVPQRALLRLLGWSGAIFLFGACAVLTLAWTLGKRMRALRH
jgi:serine/threonine-protein kinase